MDFHADKPIYQQIVDYAFARVLSGEWKAGEKVPSVRELAALMTVNTHTVLKAYDYLQAREIVTVRRGMGYFLADDAPAKVNDERRAAFLSNTAPAFFREMKLLGLTLDEVLDYMADNEASV